MKSLDQIISKYRGLSIGNSRGGLLHYDEVKAIAEEYASEVLDWVLTTEYEKGWDGKVPNDIDYFWCDKNDGTYRSDTLVEQYNNLTSPMTEKDFSEITRHAKTWYDGMTGDNNTRRELPNVKDPNK